jgi:hypothetical protein
VSSSDASFENLISIVSQHVKLLAVPTPSTASAAPAFSVVQSNGQDAIGPWPSVARALRFSDAQASIFRTEFDSSFTHTGAFVAVSAAGLAGICAAHGHTLQLLDLLNEGDDYRCPLRALHRFLASPPSTRPEWPPLSRMTVYADAETRWFDENAILELFGQDTRTRSAAFVQSIISGLGPMSKLRAFADKASGKIIPGAKNGSDARVAVLSAAAVSALFRQLLSNAVRSACPVREAIFTAAGRLIAQAKCAQEQRATSQGAGRSFDSARRQRL